MNQNPCLKTHIIQLLGPEAYRDGSLDRAWVASRVFADEKLLRALEKLVHPVVAEDFMHWADRRAADAHTCPDSDFPVVVQPGGVPYVIMESAILVESGFKPYVDRIVAVTAPEEMRVARAVARGGVTPQAVRERIARQNTDYALHADHLIPNDGQQSLIDRVLDIHREIVRKF